MMKNMVSPAAMLEHKLLPIGTALVMEMQVENRQQLSMGRLNLMPIRADQRQKPLLFVTQLESLPQPKLEFINTL